MGSSTADVTDDSATETDETRTVTDIDMDDNDYEDEDVDGDGDDECPPLDLPPFSVGQFVLVYSHFGVYEAKILQAAFKKEEWQFYVHYSGWRKTWDEWVGIGAIMEITEENLKKQKTLDKKQATDKSRKPGRASHIKPRSSAVARNKKRKNGSVIKDHTVRLEKLVNIHIPTTLKKQLVDDCEFINHLGKLVLLPRDPNVDDILNKYHDYRIKKDGMIADSIGEMLKGLRCYFDKALPVLLLYKSEREQYQKQVTEQLTPSLVYGAEHLLRLFVKLPELLLNANIEEETLTQLQQNFHDFLKFLQKNKSSFFLSSYHVSERSIEEQDD